MASSIHHVGFKIDVFDSESRLLIKFFNRALNCPEITESFSIEEIVDIENFIDEFKSLSLKHC